MTLFNTLSRGIPSGSKFARHASTSAATFNHLKSAGKARYASHPLRVLTAVGKLLAFAHVFHTLFYTIGPTGGPSMLPTYLVMGDYFLIDRAYRRGRGIQVGDCVTFASVAEPGELALKRIIGLEGDYVMMGTPGGGDDQMIKVPKGHCWVVGDNLPWSRDSRIFGPLPMALIRGKVIAKALPWKERRWIENPLQAVEVP